MSEKKSVFENLSAVNVSKHIEKKGQQSYLSWAWAWSTLLTHYPNSTYTVYENSNAMNYHTDGKTGWVKVGVKVEEIEHIEYLPIMDFKNKSIALDVITSTDVNKTIQRALTKAIARHGLGLYIYAGEDLPQAEKDNIEKEDSKLRKELNDLINKSQDTEATKTWICSTYKVSDVNELFVENVKHVINTLKQKANK